MGIILSWSLVLLSVAAFCMLGHLLFSKTSHSARFHSVLCLALLFYALGYLFEINAGSLETVRIALVVENIGIPLIGPFFLLSVMQLCRPGYLNSRIGILAMGYAVLLYLCVLTNGLHGLYYTSFGFVQDGWTHVTLGRGPLWYVNQVVAVSCVVAGYVVLARHFMQWTAGMRRRMGLIIVGTGFTMLGNLLNVLSVWGGRFDATPFAFGVTMVCFFFAVVHYNLYDLEAASAGEAVASMDDAMLVVDSQGGLVYRNQAAVRLFPSLQKRWFNRVLSKAVPGLPNPLCGRLVPGQVNCEVAPDGGETRYFRCSISDVQGKGHCILMRDMTQMVQLTQRLEQLADTDPLCRVANRRRFLEILEQERMRTSRYGTPAALIMFDLDHFKQVNDTYGHAAGDDVLRAVAESVADMLRVNDVLGRYGGEEFLILCPSTSEAEACHLAERVRGAIAALCIPAPEGGEITVRASFGITGVHRAENIEALLHQADHAMYLAKQAGRDRVRLFGAAEAS